MDYKRILSQIDDFEHQCLLTANKGSSVNKRIRTFLKATYTQMCINYTEKGFANQEEEIYFFKHVKPSVVSKIVFYKTVKEIDKLYRELPDLFQDNFYQTIYDLILEQNKILTKQWQHFDYYKSGRSDLDFLYYTLNKEPATNTITYSKYLGPTNGSHPIFHTILDLDVTCHLLFKDILKYLQSKLLSSPKSITTVKPNTIQ